MENKEELKTNGFAILRNFFSDAQSHLIKDMTMRLERTCEKLIQIENAGINPMQRLIINRESFDSSKMRQVMNTLDIIPELSHISKGLIEPLLASLTGEEWCLAKDKFIVKNKGALASKIHQDIAASDFDPNSGSFFKSKRMLTVSISIDPASAENACLRFATNYLKVKEELDQSTNSSSDSGNESSDSVDDDDHYNNDDDKYMPWVEQDGALQGNFSM